MLRCSCLSFTNALRFKARKMNESVPLLKKDGGVRDVHGLTAAICRLSESSDSPN